MRSTTMSFILLCLLNILVVVFGATRNTQWWLLPLGGDPTDHSEFPFVTGIAKGLTVNTSFCGGSIMNERSILTAASCFDGVDLTKPLYAHTLHAPDESLPVEKVRIHKDYNKETLANDIAIVRTVNNIPFNDMAKPIPIPTAQFDANSQPNGIIFGYDRGLSHRTINIMSKTDCKNSWEVNDNQVCLIPPPNGNCIGYAHGFPLAQTDNTDGVRVVSGIGSFAGTECSDPRVYTNVAKYKDWIINNIGDKDNA